MKRAVFIIFLLITASFLASCQKLGNKGQVDLTKKANKQSDMRLSSPVFENNQYIPSKYSCDAENVNPPLLINEVPEGAQSLVLIVDDPDAPAGDWVHWLVWNIKPDITEIIEDSVPQGAVQGLTDFGKNEWGGPCPPSGSHRYQFKLYALDSKLDLESRVEKKDLESAMQGHILEQSILVGLYRRQ